MGLIYASLRLLNPIHPEQQGLHVRALADSGAVHLCLPEHVALQLQLRELERREVVLADGRRRSVPSMGPVELRYANRRCFTGAMLLGDEVLQQQPQRLSVNQPGSAAIRLPISIA